MNQLKTKNNKINKICVVGLGYVGIPLVLSLASKKYFVTGFDINKKKIQDLKNLKDETTEAEKYGLNNLKKVYLTSDQSKISSSISVTPLIRSNVATLIFSPVPSGDSI